MKLRIQQIYKSNIHIGYDTFCWKFLWLKFPKLNMKLRIQQIYKYNIHIGYDMFLLKIVSLANLLHKNEFFKFCLHIQK